MRRSSENSEKVQRPFKNVEYRLSKGRELATTAPDSARMSRVRRSSTSPEVEFRLAAWKAGVRLAPPRRALLGSPDLVNLRARLVVFVHGCFWHGHAGCRRATIPKRNRAFWLAKFEKNQARDRSVARVLRSKGFRVVTVWECEVESSSALVRALRRLEPR